MFASLRNVAVILSVVAVMAIGSRSDAVPIVGSLSLAGINVTQDNTDLSVSTLIMAGDTMVSGNGIGDYGPILAPPPITSFGPHILDLTDLVGSFSLSNAVFGTFTPTSAMILSQSADFLDIFFLGDFTPGPGLLAVNPALETSATSLRISLNQSGQSISEAITLNSPPVPPGSGVPEPGAWVLMATGTLSLLGYGWRRRQV